MISHAMKHDSSHPLSPFWDLALNNIKASVLDMALRDDWFAVIDRHRTLSAIAEHLGKSAQWLRPILDLLWALGLVDQAPKRPDEYVLTPMAHRYWLTTSPEYYGDAWRFRYRSLSDFTPCEDPFSSAVSSERQLRDRWAEAADSHIAREQAILTAPRAVEVIRRLPEYPRLHHFLDLGGGPGLVALKLAQKTERLQGRVFDFPESASVAKARIDTAGLSNRLTVQGGDINAGGFGDSYDLIWASSVLHFVADPGRTLNDIYTALAPGGVFVSAHAEIAQNPRSARNTLAYYLPLRLRGKPVWSSGSLADCLSRAGFVRVESYVQGGFPMVPLTVVIARRPLT